MAEFAMVESTNNVDRLYQSLKKYRCEGVTPQLGPDLFDQKDTPNWDTVLPIIMNGLYFGV